MVNHYLLTLCPEAEDAVLTGKMGPGDYLDSENQQRCLVGCAAGMVLFNFERPQHLLRAMTRASIESRYDSLCYRFGTERTNRVIRERILANQARRELSQVRELVAR